MALIRTVRPADLDDLHRICLATGAGGEDASLIYRDPRLIGQVYAAPYAVLSPRTVFVAEDEEGVGGYIVGAPNTADFEDRLEAEWWPNLRKLYRDPSGAPRTGWGRAEIVCYKIHHPSRTASEIVRPYPAHLHINLLPRLRGRGVGRRLMECWLGTVRDMGAGGAHLAVGAANSRAIRFYRARGFHELEHASRLASAALWFAIDLSRLSDGEMGHCARPSAG